MFTENFFKQEFPDNVKVSSGLKFKNLNPGNIGSIHKHVSDMMPEWFEGFHLSCRKNLDVNKVLYADWKMGASTPNGFRLGGLYCQKTDDFTTKTPLIIGDTNPSSMATNLRLKYHPNNRLKLETRIQSGAYPYIMNYGDFFGSIEYTNEDLTATLNVYNPKKRNGQITFGILKSVSKNLCAGAEILVEWNKNLIEYNLALASRYAIADHSIAATISKDAFDVSHWRRINDNFQVGTFFIANSKTSKYVATICHQFEIGDTIIRNSLDSDWSAGFTYNRTLVGLASAFGFSVLYCIPANKFSVGLKFELNSNL